MINTSIFYAIDLDHTLFDTTRYQQEYATVPPATRPTSMEHLISASGRRLLEELTVRQLPFGIVTYGFPKEQREKLILTGLEDIPYMLADTPEKAAIMGQWKEKGGIFRLPPAFNARISTVREIVLVDDKAAAFTNMPKGIRGYLYRPSDMIVQDFQSGEVPPSVQIISDLIEILA